MSNHKQENRFIWVVALLLIILTSAPYVYGWFTAGDNYTYLGTHAINPGDNFVYYSYIEQVKEGRLTFMNLYTNEGQTIGAFNIFWLGVGSLAKLFKLSAPLAFHLVRLILIIPFCFLVYWFVSLFFNETKKRKFVFGLILFVGNLGPLVNDFFNQIMVKTKEVYYWPIDLWLSESSTFLSILQSPHLIFVLISFLAIVLLFFLSVKKDQLRYSLIAGLLFMILANFHPQQVVSLGVIILAALLLNFILKKQVIWPHLKHFLLLVIPALPALYYHWWLLGEEIILKNVWQQNVTLTPSLTFVLLSFSLLLILAFSGLLAKLQKKNYDLPGILVIVWALAGLPLLYVPTSFQARLILGWQIPLVILAGIALFTLSERWLFWTRRKNKYLLVALLLTVLILPNLFMLARDFVYLQKKDFTQFYVDTDLKQTLDWLSENTSKDSVIIAHPREASIIPALTGRGTYYGHPIETLWPERKAQETKDFLYGAGPGELKKEFLERKGVTHVLVNKQDENTRGFRETASRAFKTVYAEGDFVVYEVFLKLIN